MTSLTAYYVLNYGAPISAALLTAFGTIWVISSFYYGKRWGGLSKQRRVVQTTIAALICGIPSGWVYAESALIGVRREIIAEMYSYRSRIIRSEIETRANWANNGFGQSYPSVVPWPLLIEDQEWRIWTTDSASLQGKIRDRFPPTTSWKCVQFHSKMLGPKPATFEVVKPNRVVAMASWSNRDLQETYHAMDQCIEAMDTRSKF